MKRTWLVLIFAALLTTHGRSASALCPWQTENKEGNSSTVKLDDLPFEITSFGAARVGDTAFVYGGHTGNAHAYSTAEQSDQLLALDLTDRSAKWKVVATGAKLQGLAMVPHRSNVIVLGGFTAKNGPGEEHDLHSQTNVRSFDTQTGAWTELPDMPSGRSSHDAAIIGDTIYVVGGWTMAGGEDTEWHTTALSLDLSEGNPEWREVKQPPFERRAIATVAHQGNLFVIGGMDHKSGPSREVNVFDPKTNEWTTGPKLLGKTPMAGFGAAGWSVNGKLVVSTYEGDLLQLDDSGDSWLELGKSKDSRFFHRLVPLDDNRLIALGGANMESGKYLNLEIISIPSK